MNTRPQSEVYREYLITPVYHYRTFAQSYLYSDWEVFHGDEEKGTAFHKKTLSEVRASIDENYI